MSDSSKLKAFFKGSIILIISNVFLKAINFFLLPLYTNNLTPQMLGISDTITSFTGLLFPLLVMGLDSAYSAFYFERNDTDWIKKVFSSTVSVLVLMSSIPLVAIFFSHSIARALFGNDENSIVIVLALISVVLNLGFLPYALEIRMQNRMTVYGIITVIASLSMVLLNIYFVSVIKLGVYSLTLSMVIVYLIQLVLLILCSHQHFSLRFIDFELIRRMLHFSLPLVPTVIATWILNLSDRYVILHFWGEAEVGLYGIGSRFITLVNMVISGVSMAYTTFAYSNVNNPDAKKQYAAVLNIMYVPLIGAAFIISIFSKEIVQIMAADAYGAAYKPICDMMFAQVIYGISTITSYGIYFKKKSKYAFISSLTAASINLVLNIIFIPQYGIVAAAVTTLIGYTVMFLINYVYAQKFYPCEYGIRRIGINMLVLYIISKIIMEGSIILKIIVTIVCVIITLWMFKDRIKDIVRSVMNNI